ncbi:SDR family oxidoreductase [Fictibacillus iocasae]|uniref:SDR family oxidoreductase n=1 Tax=Fictibacillus iocasae TaxID=2715437 RepID=A0ABW2NS46_9BACL
MKHALITAGTKGLGRKVTEHLLQRGYAVTVNYRSDEMTVEKLRSDWEQYSDRLLFVKGDVTKKEDLKRLADASLARFGRIDCLINNAGPYIFTRKKLADYTEEEWDEMISGNLSAVFYLFKLTVPTMREQRFGRIVTYGFQDADHAPGWMYRSAFSAAKVGLVSLTKTIALEEAEFGITANMICPGNILGEMKEADISYAKKIRDPETPVGRSGTGEDIARLVTFLCEEDSDMVTGSVISVTGGRDVINRYRK